MKKKNRKRFLCVFLAAAMVLGQPLHVMGAEEFSSGDTEEYVGTYTEEDIDSISAVDSSETEAELTDGEMPEVITEEVETFSDSGETVFGDGEEGEKKNVSDQEKMSENKMTFASYLAGKRIEKSSVSKEELGGLYMEYLAEKNTVVSENEAEGEAVQLFSSGRSRIGNAYLEAVVRESGRFTIGTIEGNPNYTSDNNQNLLFGHPDPWSSDTLFLINESETFFEAETVNVSGNKIVSVMNVDSVQIIQTLELVRSGNADYEDTIRISYKMINVGSESTNVGVRIMLDTMIANNDDAVFRIPGIGNQTTIRTFRGEAVPQSYQVYDNLDNPTTLATGYLYRQGERKPDTVYFTNWGSINEESWCYSPNEGSALGDSAVGIVFEPSQIRAGGSQEVSTYYGVSVGSSINADSGSESIGKNQCRIRVKDAADGSSVKGAQVTVSGNGHTLSGETDANGNLLLDDVSSVSGQAEITVSGNGYCQKTIRQEIKGGDAIVVTLKNVNDTSPEITSIILDGKDLLKETVSYLEDASDEIDKSGNTSEIQLQVTCDMADCVYYLIQDEVILEKNSTGIFKFKTLKKNNGTVIDKLKSQSNRYIKCVSKDGKSSKKTKFGLKVSLPTMSAKGITKMKFMNTGNSTVGENSIAALFLGDKLKFGMTDLLDLEIEVDGSGKVRVGLNLEKMPRTQKETKELYSALLKMESRDFRFGKKQPKINMGSVEASVNVAGYGEGYLKDGEVMIDLDVKVCGNVKGSHTTNFFWIVPLYITVGAEGEIEAEIKGNIRNQDGWNLNGILPTWYSGTISPSVSVFLEGGVGTKGIANLGVEGKGTLSYSYDFVSQASNAKLGASATLKASVWKFQKSLKLAEGEIVLYDSNRDRSTVYCRDENIYETLNAQPFVLESNEVASELSADDVSLAAGTDTDPILVCADGTMYKFWIRENRGKQVCNSNELVYQKMINGSYTEPEVIENDGTSDFAPSVAVDSVNKVIYVVWQDTRQSFSDASVTVEDMARAAEINLAVLDYGKGERQFRTYSLTDNEATDTIPSVAVFGDRAAVAWYYTENRALETVKPSYISYTYVDSQGTADPVKQADLGTGCYISEITVTTLGDTPVAAYSVTEGSGAEAINNDRRAGYVNIADSTRGTLDEAEKQGGAVSGSLGGKNCLFWYQDGNIIYKDAVDGTPEKLFKETEKPSNLPEDFYVISSEEKTYLLWVGSSGNGTNEKTAYGCCYENGSFGKVHRLGDLGNGNISDVTGTFDNAGNLILYYQRTEYDENTGEIVTSELCEKTLEGYTDIELVSVDFDDSDVNPGEILLLEAVVRNNGNTETDGFKFEIDGQEIGDFSGTRLAPGEEKVLEIEGFRVPEELNGLRSFEVILSCENDENRSNNARYIDLGYAVLYVEQQEDIMMDNQEYMKLVLLNDSGISAKNVGFRILGDAQDGAVLYVETYKELAAGDSRTIYFPRQTLEQSRVAYIYLTSDTPQRETGHTYMLLSNSEEGIRYVTTGSFAIEAGSGGTISGSYEEQYDSDTKVSISAVPDEGHVFDCWVSSGEGEFLDDESADTTFIMPENDVVLTALFKAEKKAEAVTLEKDNLVLKVGETTVLNPQITPSDSSDKCSYESDAPDVVSVTRKGKITAHKAGTVNITVTCGSVQTACRVVSEDVAVTGIRSVYPTIELNGTGAVDVMEILTEPFNASEKIIYTSDHSEIVEVDESGRLKAISAGRAIITARASEPDVQAFCEVTVTNPLQSISLDSNDLTIEYGKTDHLTVSWNPEDTTDNKEVEWFVHDENIVALETSGEYQENAEITGIGRGSTLIEAVVGDTCRAYCNVQVIIPAESVTVTPSSLTVEEGKTAYVSWSLLPADSTDRVTLASSDPAVAEVSNRGEVYGCKPGRTVITVTADSGVSASCAVTVTEKKLDIVNVTGLQAFQSSHPYEGNLDRYWIYRLEGADTITIRFDDRTETEEGFDYIRILDRDNREIGEYCGTELQKQVVTVSGDMVKVHLKTDGSVNEYGFKVAEAYGTYQLSKASIAPIATQRYTGSAIVPEVKVTCFGKTLRKNTDYKVSVKNNVNLGKATVTIQGMGHYKGTRTATFNIVAPVLSRVSGLKTAKAGSNYITLSWNAHKGSTGYYVYRYDSSRRKYILIKTLKGIRTCSYTDKDRKLKYGTKYRYCVTPYFIQGKTKVTGRAVSLESTLAPKTPSVRTITAGKRSLTVTYGSVSGASGYEIYVSLSKSTGYKRAAVVGRGNTVRGTVKNLRSGRYYYVRVRSYITTKNGRIYSGLSSPKRIKVK